MLRDIQTVNLILQEKLKMANKRKKRAYRSGDSMGLKTAQKALNRLLRAAQKQHKDRTEKNESTC